VVVGHAPDCVDDRRFWLDREYSMTFAVEQLT
jgi:hypothetical protein